MIVFFFTMNKFKSLKLIASPKIQEEQASFLREIYQKYELAGSNNRSEKMFYLIMGGDGTLNYFINRIYSPEQSQIPIVYYPMGTANDFGKSLKLYPAEQVPSLEGLEKRLSNSQIRIPLMKCNQTYFINVMTAGNFAQITSEGNTLLKKATGELSYYLQSIKQFFNLTNYKVELTFNDNIKRSYKTYGFIVPQGTYAGGGVKVSIRDNLQKIDTFDFLLFPEGEIINSLKGLLELQKKAPQLPPEVFYQAVKSVRVASSEPIPVKLDGEEHSFSDMLIQKTDHRINFIL